MDEGGSSASPETQADAPAAGGSPSEAPAAGGDVPQPPVGGLFASTGRAFLVVGVAASLVVGIITASVVVALDRYWPSQDGDRSAAETTTSTPAASATTASTMPTSTTATSTSSTTTTAPDPVWQTVASRDGSLEMELPTAWAHLTIEGDLDGAGAGMFPDDLDRAALADDILGALVTPQTRFVAIDASGSVTLNATQILVVDGQGGYPGITLDMAIERLHTYGSAGPENIARTGRLDTLTGGAGWIELEVAGMHGRRYATVHGDQLWLLTYWTGDSGVDSRISNRIARSFHPNP